ncbi:MAG: sensor histidine kinase, partial [Nitrospirae bacterium]|nr:sensor histidine kinase [Nitrospirota bacterium]
VCGECGKDGNLKFYTKHDCNTACFNAYMRDKNVAFYTVPIISRMKVLGVLTIFMISDSANEKYVQDFLVAVSNVLAGIIERDIAETKIKKSLEEKMVLLKEIHHRVKNNMQIISSLLYLQSKYVKDEYSKNLILDSQSRVKSMALLHETLYQSGDLSRLHFKNYWAEMLTNLFATFKIQSSIVKITTDIENIYLDMDTAISCSLALNELISNSLKYAFPNGIEGELFLSFHADGDDQFKIVLKDNGIGLPEGIDIMTTHSLGLQLVHDLIVKKLKGSIDIIRDNGTTYNIIIKKLIYKQRV